MSVMSHDLMQCHKADEEIWEMGGGMRKKLAVLTNSGRYKQPSTLCRQRVRHIIQSFLKHCVDHLEVLLYNSSVNINLN